MKMARHAECKRTALPYLSRASTWNGQSVGLALSVGGIAGILTQTPAGGLVDLSRQKRALIGVAVAALAA